MQNLGSICARAIAIAIVLAATPTQAAAPTDLLSSALAGPQRSAKFVARDAQRHPAQELEFFGIRPDMSVVEIWPGGGYWTEILAPVLRWSGHYEVALPPPLANAPAAPAETPIGRKLAANPALYDKIVLGTAGKGHPDIAPPGSVDLVVTFRNLHNWMAGDYAPEMFAAFFRALKPGGTLGIEEHRGNRTGVQDPHAADGYVRQDTVIDTATAAGFVFDAASEINANPKDTANWPRGVWTLPPALALGDKDQALYESIGEADNSVLRFKKP
jgi:predicted methyltransferase